MEHSELRLKRCLDLIEELRLGLDEAAVLDSGGLDLVVSCLHHLARRDLSITAHVLALLRRALAQVLCVLLGRVRDLIGRLLRNQQRLLEIVLELLVLRIVLLHAGEFFLEVVVLAEEFLVVVDDLVEEVIDLIFVVAAEAALKFFVVDIEWCKQNQDLPSI